MKLNEIVDRLCDHTMSKSDALNELNKIVNGLRAKSAITLNVSKTSRDREHNNTFIELYTQVYHDEVKGIKRGDRLDIIILP